MNKAIVAFGMILTSSVFIVAGKNPVKTVFLRPNYATVVIGRASTHSYVLSSEKQKAVNKYTAKSKALTDCELATKEYVRKHRPPSSNPAYNAEYYFSQIPDVSKSPQLVKVGKEVMELLPAPSGKPIPTFFMDFTFKCHGMWVDTNPGRHN